MTNPNGPSIEQREEWHDAQEDALTGRDTDPTRRGTASSKPQPGEGWTDEEAPRYKLWKFFADNHGLTLTDTEVYDIIHAVLAGGDALNLREQVKQAICEMVDVYATTDRIMSLIFEAPDETRSLESVQPGVEAKPSPPPQPESAQPVEGD